jgi:hypothetical protein
MYPPQLWAFEWLNKYLWNLQHVQVQVRVILRPTASRSRLASVLVSGPHLGPMTRLFIKVEHFRVSCCGAPCMTRGRVCNLLVQFAITLRSKSHRTHDHILLSPSRLPQPGGPGPRIYIPQEQGGPDIPPGTGFLFVASYDSQGYGGGIPSCLYTGLQYIYIYI